MIHSRAYTAQYQYILCSAIVCPTKASFKAHRTEAASNGEVIDRAMDIYIF